MASRTPFLMIVSIGVCQSVALAACPSPALPLIFCDDFDTYCDTGGYPGGAGVPTGTKCSTSPLEPVTPSADAKLNSVWYQTSANELTSAACGAGLTLDNGSLLDANGFPTPFTYFESSPFAAKVHGNTNANPLGTGHELLTQNTFRDWDLSPPVGNPDQVLDLRRFIGNAFGSQFTAIAGTDQNPLILTFMIDSEWMGKILYSSGYIELAYGSPTNPLNRANTDYALSQNCASFCSPPIGQGPFPIPCAAGNMAGLGDTSWMESLCPPKATAPVHNALAIGIMNMLDPNPCHCGSTQAHGGEGDHLVLYDGKLWYQVRQSNPVASSGSVTPVGGAPVSPIPGDIHLPGRFSTWHDPPVTNSNPQTPVGSAYNWMTLTIKTNELKVELTTIETTNATAPGYSGAKYQVYSVMDHIPRGYLGPFNTIRVGVGPGCELAGTGSWTTCKTGTGRACMDTLHNQARFADFDNLSLSGGVGFDPRGSCCHNNATCTLELPENCQATGDQFGGPNTTCATATCCSHGTFAWADADADGDVDANDFGQFQRCYTGETAIPVDQPKCKCYDRVGLDNKVKSGDYDEFTKCETGAGVPLNTSSPPAGCTP